MAKVFGTDLNKSITSLSILAIAATFSIVVIAVPSARTMLSSPFHHAPQDHVEFSRDIRPILNQNCVACHGGVRQKNGVSFIFREEALGTGKSGRRTIVPGNPDASEFMARLTSTDPEARMPYHAPPLPPQQIALLRRWIKEGAKWEDYWAFVPPAPQPLPAGEACGLGAPAAWTGSFWRGWKRKGWSPLPKPIRRPCCGGCLSTLPACRPPLRKKRRIWRIHRPTPTKNRWIACWPRRAMANAGLRCGWTWRDMRIPKVTKRTVDRPGVWPYRDWVIDAFNRNLPYDQFVIKQLAGDLLPNATFEDRIATSFHRQTPNNDEGGTDDEEFRLVAVMDRVATTWSVLNGLTMNCVQCHSHPYDPIRHTDYYKSMAFFNTQQDADLEDDSPTLRVPKDKARYAEAAQIQQEMAGLLHAMETSDRQVEDKAQWKPLPIQNAAANEVPALEPMLPELESKLANSQKNQKLAPEKKDRGVERSTQRQSATPGQDSLMPRLRRPGENLHHPRWRGAGERRHPATIFLRADCECQPSSR